MRAEGGFTIVELVVTLVLVALLAGIATPTIVDMIDRADARSTARGVANAFRRARNQAMSRGEIVMAEVQPSDGQGDIRLYRTNGNETSCRSATTNSSNLTEVSHTNLDELSGDMQIEATSPSGNWLCFAPDGRIFDSDANILRTSNCAGMNYLVYLAPRNASWNDSLKECQSDPDVYSPGTNQPEANQRELNRQQAHFWIVHVPFNGTVSSFQ